MMPWVWPEVFGHYANDVLLNGLSRTGQLPIANLYLSEGSIVQIGHRSL